MPSTDRDPRTFLPLTPLACQVLVSLADQERHGYGIIREIEDRTDRALQIRTGTLYTLIQRLLDEGLISESDERPSAPKDDERRRYYGLTALGRAVLLAEIRRLESLVGDARRKHVVGRKSKA
jgi:DNA-binding PadR family transcriptional regulator